MTNSKQRRAYAKELWEAHLSIAGKNPRRCVCTACEIGRVLWTDEPMNHATGASRGNHP